MGEVGHEPLPCAPGESRPSHERPGGCIFRPCRLATWQEGRVARIVDDEGLIAIGVDRSVWLDARGEDGPGQLVGPVQRAGVHGPVLRPVEPFRPGLPVADAGLGQRAARPPAARVGVGAVAVVALVVHVPAGPNGGAGHRLNSRSVQVHSAATRGSPHIAVPSPPHIPLACRAHQSECGRTPPARGRHH